MSTPLQFLEKPYIVRVPDALAEQAISSVPGSQPISRKREPIDIRLEDLRQAAKNLQQQDLRGNSLQRF